MLMNVPTWKYKMTAAASLCFDDIPNDYHDNNLCLLLYINLSGSLIYWQYLV